MPGPKCGPGVFGKWQGARWRGRTNIITMCAQHRPATTRHQPTGFASKLRAAAPPSAARGELRTRGRKNGNKKAGGGPGAAEGGGAGVLRAGPGGGAPSRQGGGGGGRVRGLVCPGCAVSRCDVIMTSPWLTAATRQHGRVPVCHNPQTDLRGLVAHLAHSAIHSEDSWSEDAEDGAAWRLARPRAVTVTGSGEQRHQVKASKLKLRH